MAVTDPIADYLTRVRNAQQAGHRVVEIPSSRMKKSITEILYDKDTFSNTSLMMLQVSKVLLVSHLSTILFLSNLSSESWEESVNQVCVNTQKQLKFLVLLMAWESQFSLLLKE